MYLSQGWGPPGWMMFRTFYEDRSRSAKELHIEATVNGCQGSRVSADENSAKRAPQPPEPALE